MDEISSVTGVAVGLVFLVSACLKLSSPLAVAPLLQASGLTRVSPRFVTVFIAGCELICAGAIFVTPTWGLLAGLGLLAMFSIVLVLALRAGSRPRCGCLGDLSVAPTGPVHLARNAFLVAAILIALAGPDDRPLAALPAASALAFLLLVVPEAVEAMREFRAAVREEVRLIFERRAQDEFLRA
jgi:hypothetical protein